MCSFLLETHTCPLYIEGDYTERKYKLIDANSYKNRGYLDIINCYTIDIDMPINNIDFNGSKEPIPIKILDNKL
jgi:hypothetical protein